MTTPIVCAIQKKTAAAVVETGGQLAGELGLPVVLAYIGQVPERNSPDRRQRARAWATHEGEEILRRAHELLPDGVHATDRVELGPTVEELSAIANERDAALIIVGSHRPGSLFAAFRGSVSRGLAREAPCPVVVVPSYIASEQRHGRQATRGVASTVIAGVGGAERSHEATVVAKELADRLGDRLLLVHAHEGSGPIAIHPGGPGDSDVVIEEMPPAHALQAVAARENARLIVIGPDRNERSSLLPGSMVAQLQRLAPCPVVVVPEGANRVFDQAATMVATRAA
jgi:nucleotide-binding universal stress UspA family protein